jgi:hypothetical protein
LKFLLLLFLFSLNLSAQDVFHKKIKPTKGQVLDAKLHETSGLVKFNHRFWTHNDDSDCNLYALDTLSGEILETYNLPNIENTDWEDISHDETHFYIGDFGNNYQGNRKDLHILKIEKQSLLDRNSKIERINFSYSNQIDFSIQKPNRTNFDCEAMAVTNDSILLFLKEWKNKQTTIYSLPKTAGNYIVKPKESFKIKGLVTSACYLKSKNKLTLCGYTKNGRPFVSVFSEFQSTNFFSGKNIKYKLKPRFQQIESIYSHDGVHFAITNEKLDFLWIHRKPKLQFFELDLKK